MSRHRLQQKPNNHAIGKPLYFIALCSYQIFPSVKTSTTMKCSIVFFAALACAAPAPRKLADNPNFTRVYCGPWSGDNDGCAAAWFRCFRAQIYTTKELLECVRDGAPGQGGQENSLEEQPLQKGNMQGDTAGHPNPAVDNPQPNKAGGGLRGHDNLGEAQGGNSLNNKATFGTPGSPSDTRLNEVDYNPITN
jgi:hypothetical protein